MIFFFDSRGNLTRAFPESIKQGSNRSNRIWLFMPTSPNNVVNAYFILPNGEFAEPIIMTSQREVPNVKYDNEAYSCWFCDVTSAITRHAGNLMVQFHITSEDDTIATESVGLVVSRGVTPVIVEEETFDYDEVMAYISTMLSSLSADPTLSTEGVGADAKVVGDKFNQVNGEIRDINNVVFEIPNLFNPNLVEQIEYFEADRYLSELIPCNIGDTIYGRLGTEGTNFTDLTFDIWQVDQSGTKILVTDGSVTNSYEIEEHEDIPNLVGVRIMITESVVSYENREKVMITLNEEPTEFSSFTKINLVEKNRVELQNQIDELEENLEENVDTLNETIASTKSELEASIQENKNNINTNAEKIKTLDSKIDSLEIRLDQRLRFAVVDTRPESGDSTIIYLVPSEKSKDQNIRDEYIWVNGKWELIGSTAVDLTEYQKKTDNNLETYNKNIVLAINEVNEMFNQTATRVVRVEENIDAIKDKIVVKSDINQEFFNLLY